MYKFDTELALNSIKRSNEAIKTDSMILFAATRGVGKKLFSTEDVHSCKAMNYIETLCSVLNR